MKACPVLLKASLFGYNEIDCRKEPSISAEDSSGRCSSNGLAAANESSDPTATAKITRLPPPSWAFLPLNEDPFFVEQNWHKVMVVCVESPSLFYVHNASFASCLHRLQARIQAQVGEFRPLPVAAINCGQLCLALFQGQWERAMILEAPCRDGQVEVQLVDYGDRHLIEANSGQLKEIEDESIISDLPFQVLFRFILPQ